MWGNIAKTLFSGEDDSRSLSRIEQQEDHWLRAYEGAELVGGLAKNIMHL